MRSGQADYDKDFHECKFLQEAQAEIEFRGVSEICNPLPSPHCLENFILK
jgi:hypothetical protein